MKNVWRYTIDCGSSGGIVIAKDEKEAISKVKMAYQNKYQSYFEMVDESLIEVWRAVIDDDYREDNPDVLLVY